MFETKGSRGRFLAVAIPLGVVAYLGFGAVVDHQADRQVQQFEERAHAAFDDTSTQEIAALAADFDDATGTSGHALAEFLSQPGEPTDIAMDPPYTTTYHLDTWAGDRVVIVRWEDGDVKIESGR